MVQMIPENALVALTDDELRAQITGAWKYFFNAFVSGLFSQQNDDVVLLQALLQTCDKECKRRGIIPRPYTVWISDTLVPEMDFE